MFEHAYYCRDGDESRSVFRFTNIVAPSKACVFPLLNKPELNEIASKVSTMLTATGLSNIVDTTGNTIGKRYARTDELGIPFAVTVDYQVRVPPVRCCLPFGVVVALTGRRSVGLWRVCALIPKALNSLSQTAINQHGSARCGRPTLLFA